jgi:hypothetical protein
VLLRRRMVAPWPRPGAFDPAKVSTTRYRYRGKVIPHPGQPPMRTVSTSPQRDLWRARCIERCPPGSGSGPGQRNSRKALTAPRTDFTDPRSR